MYTDINELDLMNQPDEGDPLVWLRKHREELHEKYPTVEALMEYYRSIPSWEEISANLKKKIAEKNSLNNGVKTPEKPDVGTWEEPKTYVEPSTSRYTDINELDLMNQPDEGDPLVWLRKHRDELHKKYPTVEALMEYYRSIPPLEEISARLKKKIAEKKLAQETRETS